MALKTQEKRLKDSTGTEHTVLVDQLPALRAWLALRDVLQALAPALGAAVGKTGGLDLGNLDVSMLGGAVEQLFRVLDRVTLERLTKELLQGVTLDGKDLSSEVVFNATFRGEMLLLIGVLGFSLEVNYKDFWGGLGEKGRALQAAAKAKAPMSEASSTSSGPSTA